MPSLVIASPGLFGSIVENSAKLSGADGWAVSVVDLADAADKAEGLLGDAVGQKALAAAVAEAERAKRSDRAASRCPAVRSGPFSR